MTQEQKFGYADLGSLKMLELPYVGNEMSMIVLLPKEVDGLKQLEADLYVDNLKRWKSRLSKRDVLVFLPKFKMTSMFRLGKTLRSMGVIDAFSDSKANFAGMDGRSVMSARMVGLSTKRVSYACNRRFADAPSDAKPHGRFRATRFECINLVRNPPLFRVPSTPHPGR